MRLSAINEANPTLTKALRQIYGAAFGARGGRALPGFERSQIYQPTKDAGTNPESAEKGNRIRDGGTPAKQRHRKFFRMGNDGNSVRY